jgi:hypothetical protein
MNSICLHRSSSKVVRVLGPQLYYFNYVFNAVLINHPVKVTSVNEELINCLLFGFVNNFGTSPDVISEKRSETFEGIEIKHELALFLLSCVFSKTLCQLHDVQWQDCCV